MDEGAHKCETGCGLHSVRYVTKWDMDRHPYRVPVCFMCGAGFPADFIKRKCAWTVEPEPHEKQPHA